MSFNDKKYLIDGKPTSPSKLIDAAAWIDGQFANDWLKSTSAAATVLRDNDHVVEENPDWCSEQDAHK